MWLLLAVSLLAAPSSQEEVAIEVPDAESYALKGRGLHAIDASGEPLPVPESITFEACGNVLCEPHSELMLPLKLQADAPITVNERQLSGTIWVIPRPGGITLVNRLPLEDYLVATVGSEMPKTFPPEALRAQAVAARTFALQRKMSRIGEAVHLRSSTLDQVYGGLAHESQETREAVRATTGEVLVFQRQPIEAFFFSSCSGQTRDPAPVFGGDYPYMRSVPCTFCKLNRPGIWSLTLSLITLKKRLGQAVTDFALSERLPDGRAKEVMLSPSHKRMSPESLRKAIGYTALKSADFEVDCDGTSCHFHGNGFGHGVGMCQWGAKGMAGEGKTYKDILAHYYPGAELKKIY